MMALADTKRKRKRMKMGIVGESKQQVLMKVARGEIVADSYISDGKH
jgi:hypothetical protein